MRSTGQYCSHTVRIFKFDKSKSSRLVCCFVFHNYTVYNFSILGEVATKSFLCRTPVQATHKQFPAMEANGSFRALHHRCFSSFNAGVSCSEEVCGTEASTIHYKACSSGEFTSLCDNDLLFHEQKSPSFSTVLMSRY